METVEQILRTGRRNKDFEGERIEKLSDAVKTLLDECSPMNTEIANYSSEKERFLDSWSDNREFEPDLKFDTLEDPERLLEAIALLESKAEKITESDLEKYGPAAIDAEDIREMFLEIFEDFRLYTELGSKMESESSWSQLSAEIWQPPTEEEAERSKNRLQDLENGQEQKEIGPEEVARMFREEVDRLGMEYDVETRQVSGCFNVPQEQLLVVAEGRKEERKYSLQEARRLTMHEIFHAVRAYNGIRAGRETGFPEFLGIHTPFYDRTEEGGAVYREAETQVMTERDSFDYHLRRYAAFLLSDSDDFKADFQGIAEDLIGLGADPGRAFHLLARNRQILRHHIYQCGYDDWENRSEVSDLMVGKLNEKWAKKFAEEAEKDGIVAEPLISAEQVFDFRFGAGNDD